MRYDIAGSQIDNCEWWADWVHRVNESKKSKVLNLSGLGIQECPFAPYKPLILVDLSRNRIESISEDVLVSNARRRVFARICRECALFFWFSCQRYLAKWWNKDAKNRMWRDISPCLLNQVLATLTELNLSSNRILKIPDDIYRLFKCTYLNLTQNRITAIPESLGRMSSLTKLNINANRIEDIHPGIGMCISLKDLRMSGNRIRMLPLVRVYHIT